MKTMNVSYLLKVSVAALGSAAVLTFLGVVLFASPEVAYAIPGDCSIAQVKSYQQSGAITITPAAANNAFIISNNSPCNFGVQSASFHIAPNGGQQLEWSGNYRIVANGSYQVAWVSANLACNRQHDLVYGDHSIMPAGTSLASWTAAVNWNVNGLHGYVIPGANCVPQPTPTPTPNPTLNVSCSANISSAQIGQAVVFLSSVSGGTGNYIYSWAGDCSGVLQNCANYFTQGGTKTTVLTVTSGNQTKNASCSVNIIAPTPTPTPTPSPTPTPPTLNISCLASPNPAQVNQGVFFSSSISGGTGNYTYAWSSACSGSLSVCSTSFSQANVYTSNLTVTSGNQTKTTSCSVTVSANPTPLPSPTPTPTLNVSCYANPSTVNQGGQATFYANVSGGLGNFIYNWSGVCYGNATTCNTTINSQGTQTENLTVTSGSQVRAVTCQVNATTSNIPVVTNLTKLVKNLSTYTGSYASYAYANPGEVVQFQVMLVSPSTNQYSNNFIVKDILPDRLTYNSGLTVNGASSYTGDIISGLNLQNVPAGQTVTIVYQARVSAAQSFSFGNTTLTNYVTSTSSNQYNTSTTQNASASVIVNRAGVQGATNVPTGQTNNFLTDSFFLPLAAIAAALWFFREKVTTAVATLAFGKERAVDKKLNKRIEEIRSREK